MKVVFPQADGYIIPQGLLIAGWKVWFKRFSEQPQNWKYAKMPIHSSDSSLSDLIRANQRFSFEVLCRMMVPWAYRNQSQLIPDFRQALEPLFVTSSIADKNGQEVEAFHLSELALIRWDEYTFAQQDSYMSFAESIIQADIEVQSKDPVVLDDQGIELIGEDTYPPFVPAQDASDEEFIKALVAWIDDAPYQAYYLKQPVGDTVAGWDKRLLNFFWPKPRIGYALYKASLDPLAYRITELAQSLERGESWDQEWQQMAQKTAYELFLNSGTPQKDVSSENVQAVIEAAVNQFANSSAKINSGWSYLASLATAHFEGQEGRLPMVYWNSRISSSIISRLDFLLAEAGVSQLDERFAYIGTVPGWGGTRPRQFSLQWPNGYRCWKSQIAASQLVLSMTQVLNNERDEQGVKCYAPMPLAGGGVANWTVLGVQAVLFGDGY